MTLQETLVETLPLALDAVLTIALTAIGLEAELSSLHSYGSNTTLALWFGFMGVLALYAGLALVGRERLLPRLRANA